MAKLYKYDSCALKSDPSITGIITITWHDVRPETLKIDRVFFVHKSLPEQLKLLIQNTRQVPKGYAMLRANLPLYANFLVSEEDVNLIDRHFQGGLPVKKDPSDAQSGIVMGCHSVCTILPSFTIATDEKSRSPLTEFQIVERCPIVHVDMRHLSASRIWNVGDTIEYKNWLGTIADVHHILTVKFEKGNVVIIPGVAKVKQRIFTPSAPIADYIRFNGDPEMTPLVKFSVSARPSYPGQRIWVPKDVLSRGYYLVGSHDSHSPEDEAGIVLRVECVLAEVDWKLPNVQISKADEMTQPDRRMYNDLLNSGAVKLYDVFRGPQEKQDTGISYFASIPIFVRLSDHVIFRENEKRVWKYLRRGHGVQKTLVLATPSTTTNSSERMLVVSKIASLKSMIRVQWQDRSVTDECSTSLCPYKLVDEHDAWPGDLVSLKDQEYFHEDPSYGNVLRTRVVGVVQSVNARERVAHVRWFEGADITICGENHDQIVRCRSTLGYLTENITVISLFEIARSRALYKRFGEIVRISWPDGRPLGLVGSNSDWYGEVVQLSLDGRVSVRLGSLSPVRCIDCSVLDLDSVANADSVAADAAESDEDSIAGTNSEADTSARASSKPSDEDQGTMELSSDRGSPIESPVYQAHENGAMDSREVPHDQPDFRTTTDTSAVEQSYETSCGARSGDAYDQNMSAPVSFNILHGTSPFTAHLASPGTRWMKAVHDEYKVLSTSLPEGVYIRAWESNMEMIRVLIVGPLGTPYASAPFLFDFRLPEDFPRRPPVVIFHSWTHGLGKVNPNLYQNGRVCLSLLGTWESKTDDEGWVAGTSNIVQVVVSLLGLVLVKDPYYNEAGYDVLRGTMQAKTPAALYLEQAFVFSRRFVVEAIKTPPAGFADVVQWLYQPSPHGPSMLRSVAEDCRMFLDEETTPNSEDRLQRQQELLAKYNMTNPRLGQGVLGQLRKTMAEFETLLSS